MGIKKDIKKAGKSTKKTADKAGKAVENEASKAGKAIETTAEDAGKAVEKWATEEWDKTVALGKKLRKTAVHWSQEAADLRSDGLKELARFRDDIADAIDDAVVKQLLARLAKQIVKDNDGLIKDALAVCKGLGHVVEYTDDINQLGERLQADSISEAEADQELNRLLRVTGSDQLTI